MSNYLPFAISNDKELNPYVLSPSEERVNKIEFYPDKLDPEDRVFETRMEVAEKRGSQLKVSLKFCLIYGEQ